ncbi:MAG: type II toxin-antitoxin system VapC family toxin [Candidatus Aminicenantes bacterium]|nr:type II toxin-antitoxin system VapC family toxin [Candidatus Aminicenantes bacterium]
MVYIDTNVIVYSYINPEGPKHTTSKQIIEKLISENKLILSPLSLQELLFVFNKLKLAKKEIFEIYELFSRYCEHGLPIESVKDACKFCFDIDSLRRINDAVHLKFAEKHAGKLITFDSDFKKFREHTDLEIEIIER